jgi:hypothetical protein
MPPKINFRSLGQKSHLLDFNILPTIDLRLRALAVYIRQSGVDADNAHGESRETQLALIEYARHISSNVRIYDEGAGQSGQKRIDERPKLAMMYADCTAGLIGGIIVAREDRLFRDKHMQQVGTFTDMAEKQKVAVILPPIIHGTQIRVYDFTSYKDLRDFQEKMRIAYAFLVDHIGYMHAAKYNKALRGCYDGRPLPPGLVVPLWIDKRERKPIVYKPWADVIEWFFERLEFLDWNIHKINREIEGMAYLLKDPSKEDLIRYQFRCHMKAVPGGYKPAYWETLRLWCEQVSLIGWWSVRTPADESQNKEEVIDIIMDNHPAVVSRERFEPAYMRVTGYTLDGEPVPDMLLPKRKIQVRVGKPVPQALLHGLLTSPKAYVNLQDCKETDKDRYAYYKVYRKEPDKVYREDTFSVPIDDLDRVLVERLGDLSEQDVNIAERVKTYARQVSQERAGKVVNIDDQLVRLDETINSLMKRLQILGPILEQTNNTASSPDSKNVAQEDKLIVSLGIQYRELLEQRVQLARKKELLKVANQEEIDQFYDLLSHFKVQWPKERFERRQKLVGLLVKNASIESLSPHWLKFTIEWTQAIISRPDVCFIWRNKPNGAGKIDDWELDALKEHYSTFTVHREILQLLPERTMYQIRDIVSKKLPGVSRHVKTRAGVLPDNICWRDVQAIQWMSGNEQGKLSQEDEERAVRLAQKATEYCASHQVKMCAIWLAPARLGGPGGELDRSSDEDVSGYLEGILPC